MNPGQLHIHTHMSDGEVTPEMLHQANLGFAAITDHDTLDGVESFRLLQSETLEIISGIELTVNLSGHQAHVLVLQPAPRPGFSAALEALHDQRRRRIIRIIEDLTAAGLHLDRLDWAAHHLPTKWDLTDAALAEPANLPLFERLEIHGAKTFGRYFFDQGRVDYQIEGLAAEELFALVDGIFVLAHPAKSFDLSRDGALVAHWLRTSPMVGLEVVTRKHRPNEQALAAQLAAECGLLPVTSNDAHTQAHLFENQTPAAQWLQLQHLARNRVES